MKIDTHRHFWRYSAKDFAWINEAMPALQKDFQPADCKAQLHAAGVHASVAVQARSLEQETDYLLQLAMENPEVAGVVGWTDLRSDSLESRLDQWSHPGLLCGFRHILQDEPDVAAVVEDADFNRGVSHLQQRSLTYDVLVFDRQMSAVIDFCARHDKHWLVLDHLCKPCVRDWTANAGVPARWSANMRQLASMPHVVCKLSGVVTETDWQKNGTLRQQDEAVIYQCFDEALALFGPARLMFGSDWPVCQLAAPFEKVHGLAQSWADSRLSASEQHEFWYGSAVRTYGLTARAQAS